MNRESFIFYRSFFSAISALPDEEQLYLYRAIAEKGLNGKEPELFGIAKGMYELIKPQIEANEKRYLNGCKGAEFGKRGGRPKKNSAETPKKPHTNPKETPNDNDNVNDNVNVNDFIFPAFSDEPHQPQKNTYGSEFQKVKLTDDEYMKLIERLGKAATLDYIERLDGWLAEGNRKKSHYATILNWWRKDNPKPSCNQQPEEFIPSRSKQSDTEINFEPSKR